MPVTLIHPGNENIPRSTEATRLPSLNGRRVGLLDISKPGGSVFLDRLEKILRERYGVTDIIRVRKPTFAKKAPAPIVDQLRGMDAVVEALAD